MVIILMYFLTIGNWLQTQGSELANLPVPTDRRILKSIWDITQMAAGITYCCALGFSLVFAGIRLPKTLSPRFSSLRSSKRKSAAKTKRGSGGAWASLESVT
jgi:hypothetical protein